MMKSTAVALALALGAVNMTGCTSTGQLDIPTIIADAKVACGLAVDAASVLAVINAGVGLTVQSVVNLICGAFQAQQVSAKAAPAPSGTVVHFPVVVNGKTIIVTGTVV